MKIQFFFEDLNEDDFYCIRKSYITASGIITNISIKTMIIIAMLMIHPHRPCRENERTLDHSAPNRIIDICRKERFYFINK